MPQRPRQFAHQRHDDLLLVPSPLGLYLVLVPAPDDLVAVVVPDLAGWRRERMPAIPRDHRFEVVPDWVCEILSPSTAQKDRVLKLPLYARYGVAYAWLVDPLARTLEVFELSEGKWVLLGAIREDEPVCFPPFAAVTFALADLWV